MGGKRYSQTFVGSCLRMGLPLQGVRLPPRDTARSWLRPLSSLPYPEGGPLELLQPQESWKGVAIWPAWKYLLQQGRSRVGCDW